MADKIQKNDFVEIQFIGKTKDGEVFDTNIESEAKKINIDLKSRPLIICLGQGMILPAIDEFLIDKETEKDYTLDLSPKQAFGERSLEMRKIMPLSVFKRQNVYPELGMMFQFDNAIGKIISVTGGRVTVDFNNPLAGKEVIYDIKIKNKVSDVNEKAKSLMRFFFHQEFPFTIEGSKIILEVPKGFKFFVDYLKDKFKEILGLETEAKEVELKQPKTEDKKEETA